MSPERAQAIAASFDARALPADFYANPYPVYAALRESEPVKRMPDGVVFLTRYTDLIAVYRDAKTFSSDKRVEFAPKFNTLNGEAAADLAQLGTISPPLSPLYEHHTNSLVFTDPPLHTQVRRILMGALTRRAIAEMEPGLITLVDHLLDRIAARQARGETCDLIEDFASAIPIEVIGNLLNIPHADRGPLRGWSLAILGALEPHITSAQQALGQRSVAEFLLYLKELIAHRRQHPGNPEHDVLTRLIQGEGASAHSDGCLSEINLLHNCIFILNAGHETTTNLIGNALVVLQEWPEQRHQLLSNMELSAHDPQALEAYLNLAVDEFLRFESSNQLGNRRALQDCVVGGVALPAGSLITLCIGAANRDPRQFADAETMDLMRGATAEKNVLSSGGNKHLSFGFGIHQCAGLSLARLEARVAVGRFLQRFPNYRLTAPPLRGLRARFRGFLQVPFAV